jgi:PIN domain nuclease of toxin-antitoxin system
MIDISLEIALKSTTLPRIHKDPADRFIIATAQLYKIPVVTKDKMFNEYGVKIIN